MPANTPQQHVQAVKKADNGKYDYANMKSSNKNIQAIHDAKNDELKSERVKQIEKDRKDAQEYTFIISGFNHGPNANLLQEASVEHIMLMFDAVPNYSYSRTIEKTQYATEKNVTFSDHATIKDGVISFTAYINSSPTYIRKGNRIDQDTDPDNPVASRRPAVALELLERCINERALINLATEEGMFENYIITKLTAKRDVGEGAALVLDIEMTEFRTFKLYGTTDVSVTADPKKSPTQNKGAVGSSSSKFAEDKKLADQKTAMKEVRPEQGAKDQDKKGGIVKPDNAKEYSAKSSPKGGK
ncbi:hypothetical protein HVZ88_25435 (plasmid) [Escherichia coli]|nr:hypothetical protein HVZ88_25435 [Escherichia coli]